MSFYTQLGALIQTHPQWPAVTDAALLTWLTDEVIQDEAESIPNAEVLATILENRAEFAALSDGNKQLVRDILYIGDSVPTAAGNPARDALVSIFGGGSNTIAGLVAKINSTISRAQESGITNQIEIFDVEEARRRVI